jgi:hypothetical protein
MMQSGSVENASFHGGGGGWPAGARGGTSFSGGSAGRTGWGGKGSSSLSGSSAGVTGSTGVTGWTIRGADMGAREVGEACRLGTQPVPVRAAVLS